MDTYSHVLPGMQEEAARRVDAMLGGTVEATSEQPAALPLTTEAPFK